MSKIGLIAEGGGTKAAYSAGVLKCFLENDIDIHYVVGISAATEILCSYVSKQIDRIEVTGVEAPCQKGVVGIRPLIKEKGLFGIESTLKFIESKVPLDLDTLHQNNTEMDIGLYNMETHQVEYFDKSYITKDHTLIKASCALMILCRPYIYLGKKYMDGGLIDMISIDQSINQGCNKFIFISTKEEGYVRKPAPKYQLFLSNLLYKDPIITEDLRKRHIRYQEQWTKVQELEKDGKLLILRPHQDLGVTRYTTSPKKLRPWFQLGYDETKERIDEIKEFIR